jgi:hypothetical protein
MGVKLIDIEDEVIAVIGQLVERWNPPVPAVIPDAPPSRPRVPGAGTLPPATGWAQTAETSRDLLDRQVRQRAELSAQNVAIDLVTKKAPASKQGVRRIVEDQSWDAEDMVLPRSPWPRRLAAALLLAAVGAGGYFYRAPLRAQWLRLHVLAPGH